MPAHQQQKEKEMPAVSIPDDGGGGANTIVQDVLEPSRHSSSSIAILPTSSGVDMEFDYELATSCRHQQGTSFSNVGNVRLSSDCGCLTGAVNANTNPNATDQDLECPHKKSQRKWLKSNFVQRVLSTLVLAPTVTLFLWYSPIFATTTVCTFLTSACAYEFAWISHRIQFRFLNSVHCCEKSASTVNDDASSSQCQSESESQSHAIDEDNTVNRRNRPINCTNADGHNVSIEVGIAEREGSGSAAASEDETANTSPNISPRATWPITDAMHCYCVNHGQEVAEAMTDQRCAISGLARRYFRGNEWLAAFVLAIPLSSLTSLLFIWGLLSVSSLKQTKFYEYRWLYAISTDFVNAFFVLFAPNVRYSVVMFMEKIVFCMLTIHSTVCPINQITCGLYVDTCEVFFVGFIFLFIFHFTVNKNAVDTFMALMLDMIGFMYIVGTLSVIVAFVDDDKMNLFRELLVVLLYVVWISDSMAYLYGKTMELLHLTNFSRHRLAKHVSANKDYEGTLVACVSGVAVMILLCDVLHVPGELWIKVLSSFIAVVMGRLGDLAESLFKRAAQVKHSGRLIPGHGGVLDRIDALMFASLVFSRYLALSQNNAQLATQIGGK